MSGKLTDREKAEVKTILVLLVVSLLIETVAAEANAADTANPAVQQCTKFIDELLAEKTTQRRDCIIEKVQTLRVRLTKKIKKHSTADGLIGTLRVLTGGMFKTRVGTRLDYIVSTFRENLKAMETTLSFNADGAKEIELQLKKVLRSL